MATTRTIGPLHFEDLEPKRFEDLVRQLVYEFKPWRRLEATGRSGSDDGFDARGYEIVAKEAQASSDGGDVGAEEDAVAVDAADDRLWLIQCKRERAIGPKALLSYLDEIVLTPSESLHGLVFTAACDFSKRARDDFAEKCRALHLEEWHLWGKAELEDRLFRPENDHLLFAYFGVSLTIRRRTQKADLRARLAIKRKARRLLDSNSFTPMLLRSPDATNYPDMGDQAEFEKSPQWMVWPYRGMVYDGLSFCVQRFFAYLSDDRNSWDAAMAVNDAKSGRHEDPWLGKDLGDERRAAIYQFWDEIPKPNKAWLEIVGIVPFENIFDIDDIGDEWVQAPHIYATFGPGASGPFKYLIASVESADSWDSSSIKPKGEDDRRVEYFPAEFRAHYNSKPPLKSRKKP